MKTIQTENPIESLVEYTERFSVTTLKLLRLQLLEQSTFITTLVVTRLVVIVMYLFCFIMGSIGIAVWAGHMLGEMYLGFVVMTAFYLLAGILFQNYLYRWIRKPVSDLLIRQVQQ